MTSALSLRNNNLPLLLLFRNVYLLESTITYNTLLAPTHRWIHFANAALATRVLYLELIDTLEGGQRKTKPVIVTTIRLIQLILLSWALLWPFAKKTYCGQIFALCI